MEKSVVAAFMIIVLITVLFFIIERKCEVNADSFDKFLTVNKIKDNVLLVGLGYDDIIAFNTDGGIVAIDAGISNSLTEKYREIIQNEFGKSNFQYLINTHAHSDHTGGNQVFADAVIVAHLNCLPEMREFENNIEKAKPRLLKIVQDYEKELSEITPSTEEWEETYCQKIRYESTYNDLMDNRVVTYPSLTFDDQEHVSTGTMNFDLFYFGKAHSDSDILIHCPEQKILMTGDLFFPGGRPSIGNADETDIARWQSAKKWIEERLEQIDIVIGGHGQVMNISDLNSFLNKISEKAAE